MLLIWGIGGGLFLMSRTFTSISGDLGRGRVRKIGLQSWLGLLSSSRSSLIGGSSLSLSLSSYLLFYVLRLLPLPFAVSCNTMTPLIIVNG